jgi:hypothetical protein
MGTAVIKPLGGFEIGARRRMPLNCGSLELTWSGRETFGWCAGPLDSTRGIHWLGPSIDGFGFSSMSGIRTASAASAPRTCLVGRYRPPTACRTGRIKMFVKYAAKSRGSMRRASDFTLKPLGLSDRVPKPRASESEFRLGDGPLDSRRPPVPNFSVARAQHGSGSRARHCR